MEASESVGGDVCVYVYVRVSAGGAGRDKDMKRQPWPKLKNQKKKTHKERQFRANVEMFRLRFVLPAGMCMCPATTAFSARIAV